MHLGKVEISLKYLKYYSQYHVRDISFHWNPSFESILDLAEANGLSDQV